MAITEYYINGPQLWGKTPVIEARYVDSVSSPRNSKGQLNLKLNNHENNWGKRLYVKSTLGSGDVIHASADLLSYYPNVASQRARVLEEAIARAEGKLRKGSGSLGVSLATWGQSSRMVKGRLKPMVTFTGKFLHLLESVPPARRRLRVKDPTVRDVHKHIKRLDPSNKTKLADWILEYEFGWKPLFEDLKAALTDYTRAIPPDYVSARAKRTLPDLKWVYQDTPPWGGIRYWRFDGHEIRASVSYRVEVTNPNLWLANYLGLINLPGIAWDLVPWSFVVNMFSNAGSLVNSLTNHVGLGLSEYCTTTKHAGFVLHHQYDYYFRGYTEQKYILQRKKRTVGVPPKRSFVLRMPKGDFELGLIAGSLLTQQVRRLRSHLGT
ncbi:MAG: maturation protein [Sanya fiers-like virus 40]|nr:MAG: maturation protein [Sanya fiers-like virus 40]